MFIPKLSLLGNLQQVMPILPAEPDVYPDDLFERIDGSVTDRAWWAIYTLARREKELMRRLRAQGVSFYGPQICRRTRSPRGRMRESFVPLFAGYVFVCGGEQDRLAALATNCVSRCLPVPKIAAFEHDLQQIRRLIASNAPLTVEKRIEPGRRVRVRGGAMVGLEGTVIKRRGKDWLMVSVGFLQQGASVLLEDFQVEPL